MPPWQEEVGSRGRQRPSCGGGSVGIPPPFSAALVLGRRPKQLLYGMSGVYLARSPRTNLHQPWTTPRLIFLDNGSGFSDFDPHAARHSRPRARRQDEAHALGSLLDTLHSPSDLVPPATAHRHSSQPEYTAPPSPLPPTSSRIHAASVGLLAEDKALSGRQRPEQQAPASARSRTAAQRPPPPEPPPAGPPAGAGAGAGSGAASAAEDPKRALVHALQNDLSRMSVLLERLDELLSA